MLKRNVRHIALILTMLLLGGIANEAWAYKVTYHILTKPIDNNIYHLADDFSGKRLEAFRVVDANATGETKIGLPEAFKSPLAKNFRYYLKGSNVTKSASAEKMYNYSATNKSYHYTIGNEADSITRASYSITGNIDVYVTYEYNADNTIYKLDGSKDYNLSMSGGFLAFNRGRNNRVAIIPENSGRVSAEDLASDDFVNIDVSKISGTNITNYWNGNPNPRDQVAGQFHFKFQFVGEDPYNILIRTAYNKNYTYIEKHGSESALYYKYYKNSYLYWPSSDGSGFFLASDDHTQYTQESTGYDPNEKESITSTPNTGYFKSKGGDLTYNSFALLYNTTENGYVFMITRYIDKNGDISTPADYHTASYRFLTRDNNYNNLKSESKTLANVSENYSTDDETYIVNTYSFKVKTPFNNTISVDKEWSDASLSLSIMEHYPEGLKRKYVNIEGFYSDQEFANPVTTFDEAKSNCTLEGGKYNIYVKYSVLESLPFTAITAANKTTGYATATWYELTDAGSVQADGKKIRWDATNSVFKNNGVSGTYEKESEFAFIGDPYELRIICRKQTTDNSANYYVGCADPSSSINLDVNASDASAHYKWEIPYDDTSGSFTLREMNSTNACWQWDTSSSGNNITYSTIASTRIKVMTIGKLSYTFKIVDLAGNIAIQATAEATPFAPLTGAGVGYSMIPDSIRSPYIADETITFHSTYSSTGRGNLSPALQELPGTGGDIYVAYTTSRLNSKSITLGETQSFNVKLNDEYIYWDSSTGNIKSNASATPLNLTENQYLWRLRGRDPYAMIIDNIGATISVHENYTINEEVTIYDDNGTSSTQSRYKGAWVKTSDGSWGDSKSLVFDGDRANAARFIAMMGSYAGVYEVMAATGTDTYYHIGRATSENAEVKIYKTTTYPHGADQLRFVLEGTTLIQYHLIDKSGKEIFRNEISSKNARLTLPAEYVSPLVKTYHYYAASDVNQANGADNEANTADDIFTLKSSPTDLSEAGNNTVIYVFYDVDDKIGFGTSHPHLLKFLDPHEEGYYLEDGSDKLTKTKIQAVYPYCNGDGSLNIYGQPMNEEQMAGGSSTRPRWVWYFESDHNDPYHVKIHSKSTISFGGRSNTTYLQTFAVHFNQETDAPNKQRIVTGGNLIGITQDKATEYAVLGIKNKYKLLTIDPVKADLDGDGNTSDDGENERRYVTSFEQYWKTYNMLKLCVLGIPKSENAFSEDRSTFEMPSEKWSELKTKLTTLGINNSSDLNYVDGCSWHSYDAVASAVRWNGYNDKEGSDGYEKKKVERLEHWFQSFDMGDGTFDIEDANIPQVLVLLDRHGWEIMRKPIPMGDSDPDAAEKLAALRDYDSPMVKEYKFYSNATKGTGCHKYVLRLKDDKVTERDPIMVNGKQFTSTSLATLPSYVADQDLFVTYTVKEEYEKSYTYKLTPDKDTKTYTESGTPSQFIILQNHQYAWDDSGSLTASTAPSNISNDIISDVGKADASKTFNQNSLWKLQPNLHIDKEMGIKWATEEKASLEPHTEYETKVEYEKKTGFDPYNLQIENVSSGKYITTHITSTSLSGGAMVGDYTGGSLDVTLADWVNQKNVDATVNRGSEGYDHTYIQMTNQTFMVVQDVNGNMQLMPRFDHSRRINAFVTLANPDASQTKKYDVDDATPGAQTTFFVRPQVFDYRIIDNNGNVAMHYQTAGEAYPSIPEHFKSPLAKDFKFYKNLTATAGVYDLSDIESKEITSSFAAADIQTSADIFIRYSYDEANDIDYDNILRGRWMTMSLGGKNVQYSGTLNQSGSGIYKDADTPTKPATINSDAGALKWQWKFLQSPCVSTSSYYIAPDPYSVKISNRDANKAEADMGTAIKVGEIDRFVILNHPSGDYALAAAGDGLTYSFLNGGSMTVPSTTAASIVSEGSFTTTSNTITDDARVIFTNDVVHTFTYNVITNDKLLAAHATQDDETANANGYNPVLPESIQSELIYLDDYLYYGTVTIDDKGNAVDSDDEYTHDENSQIDNLYGLYDDVVYVRYPAFSRDNTPYLVPNARNNDSPIAVGSGSNDVAIDITGNMPYNIIWLNDNMMRSSNGTDITDGGDNNGEHTLSANPEDMWHFEGSDPYAIKIKRNGISKYVNGTTTLVDEGSAKTFMLLKRDGYDYGVLAETGNQAYMLNFVDDDSNPSTTPVVSLVTDAPAKFIPFALSVYHLIYHLVIAKTCADKEHPQSGEYVVIPYREGTENSWTTEDWKTYEQASPNTKTIYGTTQRDLTSENTGEGPHYAGEKYQLGATINGQTYSHDAGKVSLGDELEVPACFYRPNVSYLYYVEGIYDNLECSSPNSELNNKYKGLEIRKLMSDADLIGKTVRVNVAYGFLTGLETNAGEGFVTSTDQNFWYTFETNEATPYLAHYTNAWGLQAMKGRETRYTNDYLWSPVGDAYGFVMYNRYMIKNSQSNTVMNANIANNTRLTMQTKDANAVYELLAEETTTPGYFLIHPVINDSEPKYYIRKNPSDNYAELNTRENATEWTFNLSPELVHPYIDRIDYVGGLKSSVANSTDFVVGDDHVNVKKIVADIKNGVADMAQLMAIQPIVYNTDNIVPFESNYYRLHNQPVVSGINPVRYASGYLHNIEETAVSRGIPMHFYSKTNVSTTFEGEEANNLNTGFTKTAATQGVIPVPAAEYDPSTIFYINGSVSGNPTISTATMSTQGLYVASNAMGDTNEGTTANRLQRAVMSATPGDAISFKLMDIGGAVFLIHDGADPSVRRYLNFDQSNTFQKTATDETDMNAQALKLTSKGTYYFKIGESTYKKLTVATGYVASPETDATLEGEVESSNAEEWAGAADKYDLKYYHDSPTDDAKWCLEPANNQGLMLKTNDGGDGYFYATLCVPYDVQLPKDAGSNNYYAYICTEWNAQVIHPTKVPAVDTYLEGKFVPAGTPVIIRTTDNTEKIKLTIPSTSPASALSCVFKGEYLEQLLSRETLSDDDKVYTFGLPISGYGDMTMTTGSGNGEITDIVGRDQAKKGVGFFVNANPNKELGDNTGAWTPNNRYVLHNKIYYRADPSPAPAMTRGVEFIPVIFDDEDEELQPDGSTQISSDNCVYDLSGRKVATEQQVKDGTWRQLLKPGVYIINGKKIAVSAH